MQSMPRNSSFTNLKNPKWKLHNIKSGKEDGMCSPDRDCELKKLRLDAEERGAAHESESIVFFLCNLN